MSQFTDTAAKCFDENRQMFGDARRQPENFNLYNGLANLAYAVGEMDQQIRDLRYQVAQLRQELATRSR
jgi:hypothetical protein